MGVLGKYRNGNYTVTIFEDGTKIRFNTEDHLKPEMPESMDIKITNQCDMNCPFCHEDSTPYGEHADIMNAEFIDTLHPYTELAIGGGNPLCHPQLDAFLKKCKDLKLIPSMTVNQVHFIKYFDRIKKLCDDKLVYGLGVSMSMLDDNFLSKVSQFPNAVIHIIAGNIDVHTIRQLGNRNLKILILGYKHFRRGDQYYEENKDNICQNIESLKASIKEIIPLFQVVSFDNLAIKQLDVKSTMSKEEWDRFYMGDDGQYTMYIDLVNKKFAESSTSFERYHLQNNITDMFNVIRKDLYR